MKRDAGERAASSPRISTKRAAVDVESAAALLSFSSGPPSRFVARGTSGCVIRPAAQCPDAEPTARVGTVGKLFKETDLSSMHAEKSMQDRIHALDPEGAFSVRARDDLSCMLPEAPTPLCMTGALPVYQLTYEDAGESLLNPADMVTFRQLTCDMGPLFDGLVAMGREGIAHNDIKPDNVARRSDGTLRYIDFGIGTSTFDAYPQVITAHDYEYHPPDAKLHAFGSTSPVFLTEVRDEKEQLQAFVNSLLRPYEKFLRRVDPDGRIVELAMTLPSIIGNFFIRARESLLRQAVLDQISRSLRGEDVDVTMDKSDVYGLGMTLLQVVFKYDPMIVANAPAADELMTLIAGMIHPDARLRLSAAEAQAAYEDIKERLPC